MDEKSIFGNIDFGVMDMHPLFLTCEKPKNLLHFSQEIQTVMVLEEADNKENRKHHLFSISDAEYQ